MFQFKACPKCGGDIYIDEDGFGKYLSCLQCGFSKDLDTNFRILEPVSGIQKERDTTVMYADSVKQDERWWRRNRQAVELFDAGLHDNEISQRIGKKLRTIRGIRGQLRDLRAVQGQG